MTRGDYTEKKMLLINVKLINFTPLNTGFTYVRIRELCSKKRLLLFKTDARTEERPSDCFSYVHT